MDENLILKIILTGIMILAIYSFMGGIKDYASMKSHSAQWESKENLRPLEKQER